MDSNAQQRSSRWPRIRPKREPATVVNLPPIMVPSTDIVTPICANSESELNPSKQMQYDLHQAELCQLHANISTNEPFQKDANNKSSLAVTEPTPYLSSQKNTTHDFERSESGGSSINSGNDTMLAALSTSKSSTVTLIGTVAIRNDRKSNVGVDSNSDGVSFVSTSKSAIGKHKNMPRRALLLSSCRETEMSGNLNLHAPKPQYTCALNTNDSNASSRQRSISVCSDEATSGVNIATESTNSPKTTCDFWKSMDSISSTISSTQTSSTTAFEADTVEILATMFEEVTISSTRSCTSDNIPENNDIAEQVYSAVPFTAEDATNDDADAMHSLSPSHSEPGIGQDRSVYVNLDNSESFNDTPANTSDVIDTATEQSSAVQIPTLIDHQAGLSTVSRGQPEACLFVASLSAAKSDAELQESVTNHFQTWGELLNVRVLKDWMGRPYAFVQFKSVADAQNALVKGHNTIVDNRHIRIEQAKVNRTLVVSSTDSTSSDIYSIMEKYGPIESFTLPDALKAPSICKDDTCCIGEAVVKYRYREDAMEAFAELRAAGTLSVDWTSSVDKPFRDIDQFSIFVGNLNAAMVTEQLLQEKFGQYGEIVEMNFIKRNQGNPNNRPAFALLRFRTDASAQRAIRSENGQTWWNQSMRVQLREIHSEISQASTPVTPPISGNPAFSNESLPMQSQWRPHPSFAFRNSYNRHSRHHSLPITGSSGEGQYFQNNMMPKAHMGMPPYQYGYAPYPYTWIPPHGHMADQSGYAINGYPMVGQFGAGASGPMMVMMSDRDSNGIEGGGLAKNPGIVLGGAAEEAPQPEADSGYDFYMGQAPIQQQGGQPLMMLPLNPLHQDPQIQQQSVKYGWSPQPMWYMPSQYIQQSYAYPFAQMRSHPASCSGYPQHQLPLQPAQWKEMPKNEFDAGQSSPNNSGTADADLAFATNSSYNVQ
ncbi:hypothetical protein RTP6_002746 [Batrachochytrium dendrobatidis]